MADIVLENDTINLIQNKYLISNFSFKNEDVLLKSYMRMISTLDSNHDINESLEKKDLLKHIYR